MVRRSEAPALAAEFGFRPCKDRSGAGKLHPREPAEGARSFRQKKSPVAASSIVLNGERGGARPPLGAAQPVPPCTRQRVAADFHCQMVATSRATAANRN